VVDASGFDSRFVQRHGAQAPAYQAAYGELLEVEGHDFAPDEMSLMDYRTPDGSGGASATFAYVMPLSQTRIFVEETSLLARPAMDQAQLQTRFEQRLARLGLRVRDRLDREVCLIPMGMPLPLRRQRTVAFGAAASLVHPATGYQVARALRLAEPLAVTIAEHLDDGPERASRAAYEVLWPEADLRAWALYRFGMDFLADQSPARTSEFLRAFFDLPQATWLGYMTGRLAPSAICSAMLGVFRRAKLPLKTQLIRAGAGPGSDALLRAARPDNPL
jgi:lycopene beta-cyclase